MTLVHDAFVYSSSEEFLAGSVPFIREGLARGEPVLAAPTSANAKLLQRELKDAMEQVDWAGDPESHKPAGRLGLFLRYIAEHVGRGSTRVRLLGEPVWPADSRAGVTEWKRYESFLNVALAPHPVWLVCPYDAQHLPDDIVADACRTHPQIGHGPTRHASARYVDPLDFARQLDEEEPLPRPPGDAIQRTFAAAGEVRRFVVEQARHAGLRGDKINDVKLAASEIATNVFRHASSLATVRTWLHAREFVCEVADSGPGIQDPFVGYVIPEPTRTGGWGLSIARQVSDVLTVRATAAGTTVRLHMDLG